MKITNIKLTNFGGHSKLEESLDKSSVVGVIGKNGQGKSTILKAIEFAFTGSLPDTLESWIKNGTESAVVEIDFIHAGKEGKIIRKIGKGAKRSVQYGDSEVLTKASDIETLLEQIFNVDKKVISNAVFIGQGEIHKLLFGSQADRENLFVKIFNLAICEYISTHIDTKCKTILNNTSNLSETENSLKEELAKVKETKNKIEAELSNFVDFSEAIDNLQMLHNLQHSILDYALIIESLNLEISEYKKKLKLLEEKYNNKSIQEIYDNVVKNIDKLWKEKESLRKLIEGIENKNNLLIKKKELSENIKVCVEKFDEGKLEQCENEENELTHLLVKLNHRKVLEDKLQSVNKSFKEICKAYEDDDKEAEEIKKDGDEVSELFKKKISINLEIEQLKKWYKLQSEITCDNGKCSACGLLLAKNQGSNCENLKESIKSKNEEIQKLDAAYTALSNKFQDRQNKFNEYKTQKVQLGSEFIRLTEEINAIPNEDIDSVKTKINKIKNEKKSLIHLKEIKSVYTNLLSEVEKNLEAYNEISDVTISRKKEFEDVLVKITEEIDSQTAERDLIAKDLKSFDNLENSHKSKLEEYERYNTSKINKENQIIELQEKLKPFDYLYDELDTDNNEMVLMEMKARQRKRDTLDGELKQVIKYYNVIEEKWVELQKQISEQKVKLTIAGELEQLKDLFNRDGLPIQYIRVMFKKLIQRTQNILNGMDTNFVIDIDNTKEVSLNFMCVDKDNQNWLPMNKMSGGQRVRLTLAFLVALHEIVLPKLGILVLDEPSTHVDAEGVDSIKELILSIGKYLSNTESQLWICDHNINLIPAFDKVIQL